MPSKAARAAEADAETTRAAAAVEAAGGLVRSAYKGVARNPKSAEWPWKARVVLGHFATPLDAAWVHDVAACRLWGEATDRTNFDAKGRLRKRLQRREGGAAYRGVCPSAAAAGLVDAFLVVGLFRTELEAAGAAGPKTPPTPPKPPPE